MIDSRNIRYKSQTGVIGGNGSHPPVQVDLVRARKRFELAGQHRCSVQLYTVQAPPEPRQWEFFYPHFLFTLSLWEQEQNEAGKLARRIIRQLDSLWTFLAHEGVAPTNNRAERALRFAVPWRKRSLGTRSEKGNRWVEPDLAWI